MILEDLSTPWLQIYLAVLASVATTAPHLVQAIQPGDRNRGLFFLISLIIQKQVLGHGEWDHLFRLVLDYLYEVS